jgi:hypothetical protein
MNLPTYTNRELGNLYGKLPKTLQDFIMSPTIREHIESMITGFEIAHPEDFRHTIFMLLVAAISIEEGITAIKTIEELTDEETDRLTLDLDTFILNDYNKLVENNVSATPEIVLEDTYVPEEKPDNVPLQKEVLNDVENPMSIMDSKLASPTRLPKEDIELKPTSSYKEGDPYREAPTA